MKKALAFIALASVILLTFCIRGYYKISRADVTVNQYIAWLSHLDNHFNGVNIPDQMDFANESVPLHDLEVRKRFANEYISNAYWLLPSIFKDPIRCKIYSDIKNILRREQIPEDFIYLAIAESQLLNKVSPKGAAGVWQIMPSSAIGLGLEINEYIDERFDYIKATYAACRYLKQAYAELGSWTLAAASYNMGIGGISRKITLSGNDDYYSLTFNKETAAYLYRILSIKQVLSTKPVRFAKENLPVKSIRVDSAIHNLEDFCAQQGIDYLGLKQYNPWLINTKLPQSEKAYTLQIPLHYTASKNEELQSDVIDTPVHVRIQHRLLSLFQ